MKSNDTYLGYRGQLQRVHPITRKGKGEMGDIIQHTYHKHTPCFNHHSKVMKFAGYTCTCIKAPL